MRRTFRYLSVFVFLTAIFAVAQQANAQDKDWIPVTPAELSMKDSRVEPGADAEIIFWESRVDDTRPDALEMKHYVRIKILNERGREKYSKVDIPFTQGLRIKDIMARVTKADGTVVDLAKTDVFDREIIKTDQIKVKAKSFAVPGIEPGAIVEYRYREIYDNQGASNTRMVFQDDVPIERKTYYFRPAEDARYFTFNMNSKFEKDKNGFYRAEMTNVPALKSEPQMPPEDEVRSWLILYYYDRSLKQSDFWGIAGYYLAKGFEIKDALKPGDTIKQAATEITQGASSDDEKLRKIFDFCKTKVKNITFDTTLTDDQKDDIKPNKSTADTYRKLQGTSVDVNELFASLASSLGYETRFAFSGDRSKKFFKISQAHTSFIHFAAIAVKVGDRWRYFDPGSPFVPYGTLAWNEEDTAVLLLGYKDYINTTTPFTDETKSVANRTGRFTLAPDGTLEGTVKIEYTGELSYEHKMDNYQSSVSKQEEDLKAAVKELASNAELSNIVISNVSDPEKPFTFEYKLRIPNYAQKTGKRLFFQPGVFEYGSNPRFSSASRKYDIFFHYPWTENDDIEIKLPAGFDLDAAEAPAAQGDSSGITKLSFDIGIDRSTNTLKYTRTFYMGHEGKTLFPSELYGPLKGLFDGFYKANTYTLGIKQQ